MIANLKEKILSMNHEDFSGYCSGLSDFEEAWARDIRECASLEEVQIARYRAFPEETVNAVMSGCLPEGVLQHISDYY